MIYQWTAWNRQHIAKHGLKPEEAQYVLERARPPFPRKIEDDKLLVWGQTAAGRYVQVIYVYLSDEDVDFLALSPLERIRFESGEDFGFVIHARDLTADQKRQYRRLVR